LHGALDIVSIARRKFGIGFASSGIESLHPVAAQ